MPDHSVDDNCCFQPTPLGLTLTLPYTQKTGKIVSKCHSKTKLERGKNEEVKMKAKAMTKTQSQGLDGERRHKIQQQQGSRGELAELSGDILSVGTHCDFPLSHIL